MAQGRSNAAAGRWATSERRDARRDQILDATLTLLESRGYAGVSMHAVAQEARASKETLYAWFGDKAGLFEALVSREAMAMNADLGAVLDAATRPADPGDVLRRFGRHVVGLLLGPRSIRINRAAIAAAPRSPELGRILAASGRDTTRPLVERFLADEHAAGRLRVPDPTVAFGLLMGLLVGDEQIRLLLGVRTPPRANEIEARVARAVDAFLRLHRD